MPLSRIGDTILYFAHIPKTGGSSIEAYLAAKGPMALRCNRRLGWSTTTAQHMDGRIHTKLIPDDFFDDSFTVLRDPVARMVSEYRCRMDRYAKQRKFGDWVRAAFDAYGRDPWIYDNHIRPQTDFLRPNMALFRLELGMDVVYDWIDAVTGTAPGPRDIWQKKSAAARIEVSDETRDEIAAFYAADVELLAGMADRGLVIDKAA